MEYKVIRQHFGDKQYVEGDMREVPNEIDAKQLADLGLIEENGKSSAGSKTKAPAKKAAPKPKNKMAEEPNNKAE